MNKNYKLLFFTLASIALLSFVIAAPNGGTITENSNSTSTPDSPESAAAFAGNVTSLDITGYSVTQTWQGYYGNVTGTIELEDSSNNVLYNWTLATPEGEIYASTNGSGITWGNTQCFNFTAQGTYADDTSNAGATSQFGSNLTYLEALYNIGPADADGVNETFSINGTDEHGYALTHDTFFTNGLTFTDGECPATHLFDNDDNVTDSAFQEVLLYEPSSASIIFTAILDQEDVKGFNNIDHDFEMLVLEDGHSGNTAVTTYFFYVELE